jgi:hypothetical protein
MFLLEHPRHMNKQNLCSLTRKINYSLSGWIFFLLLLFKYHPCLVDTEKFLSQFPQLEFCYSLLNMFMLGDTKFPEVILWLLYTMQFFKGRFHWNIKTSENVELCLLILLITFILLKNVPKSSCSISGIYFDPSGVL